jgi:hypothetical protein
LYCSSFHFHRQGCPEVEVDSDEDNDEEHEGSRAYNRKRATELRYTS